MTEIPSLQAHTMGNQPGPIISIVKLAVLGAVLGTSLDCLHVASGVLSYNHPQIWKTSLWVPVIFGTVCAASYVPVSALSRSFSVPTEDFRSRALRDVKRLFSAYLLTAVFVGREEITLAALLILAVIGTVMNSHPLWLVCGLFAAVVGSMSEALLVHSGFFQYLHSQPIPYWLPLLWLIAGYAMTSVCLLFKFDESKTPSL